MYIYAPISSYYALSKNGIVYRGVCATFHEIEIEISKKMLSQQKVKILQL